MIKEHLQKNRAWYLIPLIILGLFDSCTLLPILTGAIKKIKSVSISLGLVSLSIFIYVILIYFSWHVYCEISHRPKNNWSQLFHVSKKTYCFTGIGLLCLFGLNILIGIISKIFAVTTISTTNEHELLIGLKSDTIYKFGLILCSVILAPLLEELLYRGVLMRIISPNLSFISVIISCLIFDIMHQGFSLISLLTYGGFGFILGILYKYTHSLKASILLHSVYNLIGYLPLL